MAPDKQGPADFLGFSYYPYGMGGAWIVFFYSMYGLLYSCGLLANKKYIIFPGCGFCQKKTTPQDGPGAWGIASSGATWLGVSCWVVGM